MGTKHQPLCNSYNRIPLEPKNCSIEFGLRRDPGVPQFTSPIMWGSQTLPLDLVFNVVFCFLFVSEPHT